MTDSLRPALDWGTIFYLGAPAATAWYAANGALYAEALRLSEGIEPAVLLEVHMHVDGTREHPEFEGVRTGRFSKLHHKLWVQVAVSLEAVEHPRETILASLEAGVQVAEDYAIRRNMDHGFAEARGILTALQVGGAV